MLEEYCTTLEWLRQQIKRRYPTLGVDLTGFQIELTKTHAWVLRSMIKMLSDYISDNDNTYQLTLDWMNQEMNTKQTHSNTQTNLVFPDMSLTFAGFFCGCSGLSLGFIQAGLKCVSVMDIAHETISTYWYNLCYKGWSHLYVPESTTPQLMVQQGLEACERQLGH